MGVGNGLPWLPGELGWLGNRDIVDGLGGDADVDDIVERCSEGGAPGYGEREGEELEDDVVGCLTPEGLEVGMGDLGGGGIDSGRPLGEGSGLPGEVLLGGSGYSPNTDGWGR